nr:cysteine-rich RLK (receptor-like protein kinase) 8 [Tanacetum cinerariifolium]
MRGDDVAGTKRRRRDLYGDDVRMWPTKRGYRIIYVATASRFLSDVPLPLMAKAYSMLRQEEKQRDAPKHHSTTTPIVLNSFRNTYTPPHRNNNQNTTVPNTLTQRRNNFRKRIFYVYCKKEGNLKEECYKMLGYPPGHPLHNKYQPPSQRGPPPNKGGRSAHMVVGETLQSIDTSSLLLTSLDQCSTSASPSTTVVQTEFPGMAPHVAEGNCLALVDVLSGGGCGSVRGEDGESVSDSVVGDCVVDVARDGVGVGDRVFGEFMVVAIEVLELVKC